MPRAARNCSVMNWCTGMSSTAVIPSRCRCAITAGWAIPAYVRRAVAGVPLRGVGELVVEQGLVPADVTLDRLAVRVEQQFGGLAAEPARGVVRSVHAVAVPLPRCDAGQVTV